MYEIILTILDNSIKELRTDIKKEEKILGNLIDDKEELEFDIESLNKYHKKMVALLITLISCDFILAGCAWFFSPVFIAIMFMSFIVLAIISSECTLSSKNTSEYKDLISYLDEVSSNINSKTNSLELKKEECKKKIQQFDDIIKALSTEKYIKNEKKDICLVDPLELNSEFQKYLNEKIDYSKIQFTDNTIDEIEYVEKPKSYKRKI